MTAWDVVVELAEAARRRCATGAAHEPAAQGYPVLRAITNVFLRELSAYMVTLDVIRGAPTIYTTFVGYDEVAHHAGPDTSDAMGTLRAFDRTSAGCATPSATRRRVHTICFSCPTTARRPARHSCSATA